MDNRFEVKGLDFQVLAPSGAAAPLVASRTFLVFLELSLALILKLKVACLS